MTNIVVEDISQVKKKLTFEIPREKLMDVIDAEYRDLKKSVQLKGFRKGKVPLSILRAYFKVQVEDDAKKKMIEETLESGLEKENITPVAVTKIEPEDLEEDKPFRYTAEVEVYPAVEIKEYKGLELTKYLREVTDDQVLERLEAVRSNYAKLAPIVDRGIKTGDHLVVDVKSEINGENYQQLSVEDYHMELGRDFYLPNFDSNLDGLEVGQTKEVEFNLPENFARKDIAGKPGTFQVTVKEAKERVLPELNDDLAKDLGEYQTIQEYRDEVRRQLQEQLEAKSKQELEQKALEQLIEINEFPVPEAAVERQMESIFDRTRMSLSRLGIDPRTMPPPSEEQRQSARPVAERNVKASLILDGIAKQEGLEVSDEDLDKEIEKNAEEIGLSLDSFKDQLESSGLMEDYKQKIVRDKAMASLLASSKITEAPAPEEEDAGEKKVEEE